LKEKVAVITCTGDRALAWKLCKYYQSRWMDVPHTWVVIDGPAASYDLNLYRAFRHLPKGVEKIVIMEDDDWYGPNHLKAAVDALDKVSLYGEAPDRWYNIRTPSYGIQKNTTTAALASTAFRVELIRLFYDTLDQVTARFLDMNFWERARRAGVPHLLSDNRNVVGIKGMPGRGGLGYGHRIPMDHRDPAFDKLREWIGLDYEPYRNLHSMLDFSVTE